MTRPFHTQEVTGSSPVVSTNLNDPTQSEHIVVIVRIR